jgi:hypothetical protein
VTSRAGPAAATRRGGRADRQHRVYNAFEAGDLDLMAAVWLPEPDPVCIHPGNAAIYGYNEDDAGVGDDLRQHAVHPVLPDRRQVRVDEDVAYVTCTENVLSSGDGAPEEGFAGGKGAGDQCLPRHHHRVEVVDPSRLPGTVGGSTGGGWMSGAGLPPDVIEIRGIRGFGRHGVFDHERADGQEFSVDVRLELDTRAAAASDRLADTVNYGTIAERGPRRDRERPC